MCLNYIGICMYIANLWKITEDDLKKVSVYAAVYYVAHILMMLDSGLDAMNEEMMTELLLLDTEWSSLIMYHSYKSSRSTERK